MLSHYLLSFVVSDERDANLIEDSLSKMSCFLLAAFKVFFVLFLNIYSIVIMWLGVDFFVLSSVG